MTANYFFQLEIFVYMQICHLFLLKVYCNNYY